MKVSTLTILLCHHILVHSVVEAKLKVSILNVSINKTSPKFVNVVKFDVSSDSLVNIETDLLQDLTSAYVKIIYNKLLADALIKLLKFLGKH